MASKIVPRQTCTKCSKPKLLTEFNRNTHFPKRGSYRYTCRSCDKAYRKHHKVAFALNVVSQRHAWMMKHRFGISPDEYNIMLTAQEGMCAICRQPERSVFKGVVRRLAVDHSHTTGKVRGLLCLRCNTGLGRFLDNPVLLRDAADYLSTHE